MQLLVYRFSAMGDVALTVPALRGVLKANPKLEVTLVSSVVFAPLFHDIDRLTFYGVRLNDYSGFRGMRKLYKELSELQNWAVVIDLHSVLRSWILNGFFRMRGTPVFRINKGREEKAALVAKGKKELTALKHTTERYLDVFRAAGLATNLETGPVLAPMPQAKKKLEEFLKANGINKVDKWIGLAPFSVHRQKTWPYHKITELIELLGEQEGWRIFLIGGPAESEELRQLAAVYEHCHSIAGLLSLEEEIALMYELDAMVAMDSFNMHLAALCNRKVISIWGGTHHFAGFGPLNDNIRNIVEVSTAELPCRPCSVFGNKPCHRKDWACLERIDARMVIDKI